MPPPFVDGDSGNFSIPPPPSPVLLFYPLQQKVGRGQIKLLWIKFAANPINHPLMLVVFRIADRVKKIGISPDATDILRRTRPTARHTDRIDASLLGGQNLLDHNVVIPTITKVVKILKLHLRDTRYITKFDSPLIVDPLPVVRTWLPKIFTIQVKMMEVITLPPKRDLDDAMQLAK